MFTFASRLVWTLRFDLSPLIAASLLCLELCSGLAWL